MKFGRKPARFTRESFMRSHVLARHLSALGPAPATPRDWVSAVTTADTAAWGMFANGPDPNAPAPLSQQGLGDCVIADCAHQEMLRTANVGTIWIPTDLQVLALYTYFQGMNIDPNSSDLDANAIAAYLEQNDNGCDELTVIQYLTTTGWQGRKLGGSANLDPTQLDQLKWAVCIFGASRLGLNLPQSAMDQFNAGQPWDYVAGSSLDGGHDVPIVQYDANYVYVVTWGQLQPVTYAFLAAKYDDGTPYVDEAHAELAFDWVNAAGTCPDNLDLAQLQADLSSIVSPTPALHRARRSRN